MIDTREETAEPTGSVGVPRRPDVSAPSAEELAATAARMAEAIAPFYEALRQMACALGEWLVEFNERLQQLLVQLETADRDGRG